MKSFQLHPQAKVDLLAAAEYYESKSWALAGRFSAEMDRLVQEACANPGVHRLFWAEARRQVQ